MQFLRGTPRNATSWVSHALYVDRSVIVVNKPPGLICQLDKKSANVDDASNLGSFLDDLTTKFDLTQRPTPVHRLDKATTGALVFARTPSVARDLSKQFQLRTVEKDYLAIVRGGEKSFPTRSGEIRGALNFDDGKVSVATDTKGKRMALTQWEVLASSSKAPLSLVKLKLHTGLKHQLRVHMAQALQAPILGDTLYSKSKMSPAVADIVTIPSDLMYLHASHVSFFRYRTSGPHKQFRLGITAPLSRYFVRLCAKVDIPLSREVVQGGVYVNGEPLEYGKIQEITEGSWVG